MTIALNAFKELLCKGMNGDEPDFALFENLTEDDWETVYLTAKRQTVCGICYDSICRLPDRLLPSGSLLPRWVARVNAIENRNTAMRRALNDLLGVFSEAGLHPVVQKGLSVARFYPNPDLRESGDIDLWLSGDELSAAYRIITDMDCSPVRHPDGSISFSYKGFIVEFHRSLISISNPAVTRKFASYTERLWRRKSTDSTALPSPPPVLELLLLNVHIMRHAFGNGIGLRQICDYVLASRALHGNYLREEFENCCRILGISRWTALLNQFAVSFLDADPAILPPAGIAAAGRMSVSKLFEIVSEGGNFGQHLKNNDFKTDHSGKSKIHTLKMLARRSRFAASIAPAEAFWNFVRLLVGQIQ